MQQLWSVLGPEGSKYVVWVGVGLALLIGILLVAWGAMRIFGRTLNMGASGRGQPQRLGITGAFNLDRKGRKLVIVRRDNVEHLILIGGPNDLLIEQSIIRAERAGRPAVVARESEAPAAAPPAITPPAAAAPAAVIPVATPAPPPQPAPAARPAAPAQQVQPLLPPAAPPPPAPRTQPAAAPPVAPPTPPVARPAPPPATPVAQPAPPPPRPVTSPPLPAPPAPVCAAEPPPKPVDPVPLDAAATSADARLSDMARRLQSVLKTPLKPVARTADPVASAKAESIPIPLPSQRPAEPPPPAPAAVPQGKPIPPAPAKADAPAIDSLEEEMARLLGRAGPQKM